MLQNRIKSAYVNPGLNSPQANQKFMRIFRHQLPIDILRMPHISVLLLIGGLVRGVCGGIQKVSDRTFAKVRSFSCSES